MRKRFTSINLLILLALIVSCSSNGTGQKRLTIPLPKHGLVHEKIAISGNPQYSYALYIPETTHPPAPPQTGQTPPPAPPQTGRGGVGGGVFPVIVAFDPHGNGVLPLSLYKNLAKKYGFIMVGSNDSKNGMPADQVKEIVNALILEVRTVYPVDTNRIFLLGFSGGARVAAMAAMYQTPVKGVIGCGAGFGGAEQPPRYKFDYFGMVGTADFNMSEMLQLNEPLSRAGFRHFIATFPGIHAWPPAEEMEDGFIWLTLNAMKDGVIKKDDSLISGVIKRFDHRIKQLSASRQLIAASDACLEAISFTEGFSPVEKFKLELAALEKQPAFQSQVASRLRALKKEEDEKQELMQALQGKDLNWWKGKITNYKLQMTNEKLKQERISPEDTLKNRRLLAFLSLFCYMNANAAMARDENAAIKIIAIYEMADDTNPEPNYMRAILFARRSENEAVFAQLKIAVSKGFADRARLSGQPEFRALNSSPDWFDILKTCK